MKQMTEAQAIALYDSKKWETWTDEQIVALQMYQDLLCIPFGRFHAAVEKVLGRPIWTHEFAGASGHRRLIDEYEGKRPRGTVRESFDLLLEMSGDKPVIAMAAK